MKVKINKLSGRKLHIIDVSGVARSRWYSFKDLSWEVDGKTTGTGAIYAVLSLFKTIPLEDRVIFCFDFGGNSRKDDYDGYKSNRTFKDSEYFTQMNKLREILINCGFDVYGQSGYEADDFIAGAVNAYYDDYDHLIIHANDKDLTQLIDEKVIFKNILSKQSDITFDNYEKELNIPYNTIALYKSTVGDPSDKIKGIPRFGPKKFEKFIEDIENKYDFSVIRKNDLERDIIKEYEGFSEKEREDALNSLRVVLPRIPNDYHFEDSELIVDGEMLKWYLDRYGMKSIIKNI